MPTPGAVTSGLTAPSPSRGPRLEKPARESSRSTAPTVSAASAVPGEPMVDWPLAPSLPAAMTNSESVDAVSALTAWLMGSVPSVGPPPRLMLITLASWAAAHSMPSMTEDSVPYPLSSSTLPTSSSASAATPRMDPPDAAPVPPTVAATCVPWPKRSPVLPLLEKSLACAMRPDRSGCLSSTPVSRTATLTPLPW